MVPAVGDVFEALADPTRRAILDALTARNDQTLFELCARQFAALPLIRTRPVACEAATRPM